MSAERDIAMHWRAKAANDLLDADNNLAARETPCDTVCFHCQQAAEKLLKAFLSAKGVPPPRMMLNVRTYMKSRQNYPDSVRHKDIRYAI